MASGSGVATGANVEYFFRLIYDFFLWLERALTGGLAHSALWWTWITAIGYGLAVFGMGVIVYALVRLFELRHYEEEELEKVIPRPDEKHDSRWSHVESLMGSENPNDWRQAIIEADIMLDDVLARAGYVGDGVGEKLRQAKPEDFATLREAGEAHGVRNQIAHAGSAFVLDDTLARRTIQKYEAVFRELNEL